jgi:hypothetical protein
MSLYRLMTWTLRLDELERERSTYSSSLRIYGDSTRCGRSMPAASTSPPTFDPSQDTLVVPSSPAVSNAIEVTSVRDEERAEKSDWKTGMDAFLTGHQEVSSALLWASFRSARKSGLSLSAMRWMISLEELHSYQPSERGRFRRDHSYWQHDFLLWLRRRRGTHLLF